jgi:hypothetical protein
MSGSHSNQFSLLRQRRFAPFFWTQFLGAGNDNLFKFALTVLVTYQLQIQWLPPAMAGLAIGALFILPFLLFSATSGQLADKLDKTLLMRLIKSLAIFPEGAISRDGELGVFKAGVMKVLGTHPVPVVPLALHNLWGSFFSRVEGAAMTRPFRRGLFSRVGARAGAPLAAAEVTPQLMRERVAALLAA